jgi:hypothetical protein
MQRLFKWEYGGAPGGFATSAPPLLPLHTKT